MWQFGSGCHVFGSRQLGQETTFTIMNLDIQIAAIGSGGESSQERIW